MNRWITLWRIASSSAGLARGAFFALGLPPPNTPIYKTYSEILPQSQGGQTQQGYINVVILWSELDFLQARTLRRIVDAAVAAGTIYLTVDKADGSGLANAFIDISGVPIPLTLEPAPLSQGRVFQNVELRVNNCTVTADPSTAI